MARRLGAWDCTYCETERIMGNVFDCPGCGHPRPLGVRFYPIPDGPIVTPEIAKQLGSGGPNWYCEHCQSGNKDDSTSCWNCGAEKGSSPSHEVKYYKEGEEPHNTEEAELADDDKKSWVETDGSDSEKGFSLPPTSYQEPVSSQRDWPKVSQSWVEKGYSFGQQRNLFVWLGAVVALVLAGFLIYQFFFNTREKIVKVSEFHWTQSVEVREFMVVHDSSWTTHPSDAYNVTETWKDTGRDEKVHDRWDTVEYQDTCYETETYQDTCTRSVYQSKTCTGTRDNGDGSFDTYSYECGSSTTESYSCTNTRQVPYSCTKTRQEEVYHYEDIYDNYYTYDVNRWISTQTYPTSGNDHEPYFFTDFVLNNPYEEGMTPQLGQQKEVELRGEYTATFFCEDTLKVGQDGYFTRQYDLEEWKRWEYDTEYVIEINAFNSILTYPQPK